MGEEEQGTNGEITENQNGAVGEPETAEANESEERVDFSQFTEAMNTRVKTLRQKAKRARNFLKYVTVACLLASVAAVFIHNFFIPVPGLMMLVAVFLGAWIVIYSKFVLPLRMGVTCHHCEKLVNLNQDWVCGHCDDLKRSAILQTFVSYRVPVETCKECTKTAVAIECPHCEQTMVIDVPEYERLQSFGGIKPGVAKMV